MVCFLFVFMCWAEDSKNNTHTCIHAHTHITHVNCNRLVTIYEGRECSDAGHLPPRTSGVERGRSPQGSDVTLQLTVGISATALPAATVIPDVPACDWVKICRPRDLCGAGLRFYDSVCWARWTMLPPTATNLTLLSVTVFRGLTQIQNRPLAR